MKTPEEQPLDLPDAVYEKAKQGHLPAQEEIVLFHQRPIRAWVVSHAPPGVDADDIAQRTFVAALTKIDDFEVGTNFRAWLYTIARFQLMTETTRMRRVADYHSRFAPELFERELERRSEYEVDDWTADRVGHLRECLEGLRETAREIVGWRYTEEIPLTEMARRSGRSVAAMKKQLWLARRNLQSCIEAKLAKDPNPSSA